MDLRSKHLVFLADSESVKNFQNLSTVKPCGRRRRTTAVVADGRGTYTGKVTLFCDAHGCDVHNVVVSDLKAVVVRAPVPG
jgi:hypothetical protein